MCGIFHIVCFLCDVVHKATQLWIWHNGPTAQHQMPPKPDLAGVLHLVFRPFSQHFLVVQDGDKGELRVGLNTVRNFASFAIPRKCPGDPS